MTRSGILWLEVLVCLVAMAVGTGRGQSSSSSGQGVPLVLPSAPGFPAAGAAADDEDRLSPQDSAKRNSLMQPGIDLLKQGNNKAAYASLSSVLNSYPNDLFVLRYTAAAAMGSDMDEQALALFRRVLALYPRKPWPVRNAVILLEARLNRWPDLDRDLAELRLAKKNGMDHGLDDSSGFVIDEFDVPAGRAQGEIYPQQAGRYHMLYRFVLPPGEVTMPSGSSSNATAARCDSPDFRPHLDVESVDVDQAEFAKAHPDRAAKGDRSYTLVLYGRPCAQALVGFYPDGEPTYEKARADALKVLNSPAKR